MKKPESKLQELVTRLQQACGENLVSVVLYGSAAREDFHEQFSDVNVLVVLQHLQASSFAAISTVLQLVESRREAAAADDHDPRRAAGVRRCLRYRVARYSALA